MENDNYVSFCKELEMKNAKYLNFCKELEQKGVDWVHWESEFEKHNRKCQETEIFVVPLEEEKVNILPMEIEEKSENTHWSNILDANIPCTNVSVLAITLYCSLIFCISLIILFFIGLPLIMEEVANSYSNRSINYM
jgi:hypothetical protein